MSGLAETYLSVKKKLFDRCYNQLNEMQRAAVYHTSGPLLILAGAGSGKTTVLVKRIAYIIRYGNAYYSNRVPEDLNESHVEALLQALNTDMCDDDLQNLLCEFSTDPCPPWRVLAITFTNKAAKEIKERLAAAFPDNPDLPGSIVAGTFHSVCVRILRRYTSEAGLCEGFTIYDADDSKKTMQATLRELNIDEKVLSVKSALSTVSRAKDKLVRPEDFGAEFGNDFRMQQLGKVYAAYQEKLKKSNALDFDDIIFRTVVLLESNAEIRTRYQKQFRYVSVDEYQDTNPAQFRLTALLSDGYRNLMVVGDDDQSIYKFRGATIENILQFDKTYPEAAVIRLEQNYRSTKPILDAANAVIAHNESRKGKTLWTDRQDGEKIRLFRPADQNAEARKIISVIQEKVARQGRHYRDFAVLYRTNAQSQAIEMAFAKSAVPYRMLGGLRFTDRKEIRDLVAYLQLINNHADRQRLLRIVNEPRRKIGEKTLSAIEEIADLESTDMFSVMEHADSYLALSRSAGTLREFCELIRELTELQASMPLSRFVDEVLDRTGYRQMIREMGPEEADRLDNLREFISGVIEYETNAEQPTLTGFLEETALVADVDRYDETADAVVMMTIHSAKGLEFPEVFLPGFEEGIFPGLQTILGGESEIEEERRLAYVAITRARNQLYILYTDSRTLYGRTGHNPPSRFLSEIPEDLICREEEAQPSFAYRTAMNAPHKHKIAGMEDRITVGRTAAKPHSSGEPYIPGDRVRHMVFGEGVILSVKPMGTDLLYEVAFDTVGTKKLMATYAKLQKIK